MLIYKQMADFRQFYTIMGQKYYIKQQQKKKKKKKKKIFGCIGN